MNWLYSVARRQLIEAKLRLEKQEIQECEQSLWRLKQTRRAIELLQEALNGFIQSRNERH